MFYLLIIQLMSHGFIVICLIANLLVCIPIPDKLCLLKRLLRDCFQILFTILFELMYINQR